MSGQYSSAPELTLGDACAILRLRFGATDRDVKAAYRRLSLKFHPDKRPGDPKATSRFQIIVAAYEMILHHIIRLADLDFWMLHCSTAEHSIYAIDEDFKADDPDVEESTNEVGRPANGGSLQYFYRPETQYSREHDTEHYQYRHANSHQYTNGPNRPSNSRFDSQSSRAYNGQRFRYYWPHYQIRYMGNRPYGNPHNGAYSHGRANQNTHARNRPYTSGSHSQPSNDTAPWQGNNRNGADNPGFAGQNTRPQSRPNTFRPGSHFHNDEHSRQRSNRDSPYNHVYTNQNTHAQSQPFAHDLGSHDSTQHGSRHSGREDSAERRPAADVEVDALNETIRRMTAHLERENWRQF